MLTNPFSSAIHYQKGIPLLPGAFPVMGHVPTLIWDSAELLRKGRERLGDIFRIRMGSSLAPTPLLVGPEGFELLRNKSAYIPLSINNDSTNADFLGRHGLLVLRDTQHQRMRAALNPPFVPRGLSLSGIGSVMSDCIHQRLLKWSRGSSLRILSETQSIALEIIFRLLDVKVEELQAWQDNYRQFMQILIPIKLDFPGSPRRRALRARSWLDAQLTALIERSRQAPEGPSLVSAMSHARDEGGQLLSMQELIDNFRLLILAGHETTASVMAWMVTRLAQDPELLGMLQQETVRVGHIPQTPQQSKEHPVAEALFRETLRLYPPLYITGRMLAEPTTLAGHRFAAGQQIFIGLGDIARDPRFFTDPERFDLQRWLTRSGPPSPLLTSQFGGGPHFCLGYHLAVFEGIQFAAGLALHLKQNHLRLRLKGATPKSVYYPLHHPAASTTICVE